jgi:superfamily II DNA helicase RecQ
VRAVTAPVAASRRGRLSGSRAGAGAGGTDERNDLEPVDEQRFERLRAWRYERAEGKPAYTVAANAVLEDVLRATPSSVESLLQIRGIGPAFCEKHGESLLAELAAIEAQVGATGASAAPLASGTAPT